MDIPWPELEPEAAAANLRKAVLVHALDDRAAAFYRRHGFDPSPTDSHNLQMLIKDVRRSAETSSTRLVATAAYG
jgi:hypothetical protein